MSEPAEYLPGAEEAAPEPETQTEALAVVPVAISPMVARDAGIAAYLASAYGKAGTLRLTPEETKALKADFPDEAFITGAAGKESLIYLDPRAMRDRLDDALGMGGWSLVPIRCWTEEYKTSSGQAIRVYRECVLIVRGVFITQATGDMSYYPSNQSQNYGDAYQGAESHSLRRCLKNFGIGLQAYSKPFQASWLERRQAALKGQNAPGRAAASPPPNHATPPATTPEKLVSANPQPPKASPARIRAVFLQRLGAHEEGVPRNTLHSYLVALKWLENNKVVEQLAPWYLPDSPTEFEAFTVGLAQFSQTGTAALPYQPHGEPAPLQGEPVKPVTPPAIDLPSPEPPPAPAAPGWRDHVMAFGAKTKGKNLGSLDPKELQYYCDNFSVAEYREDEKGIKNFYAPAIVEAQKALRAALDEAAAELATKKG